MAAMSTKTKKPRQDAVLDREGSDADLDRYLAEHHDSVAAKLAKARASIAQGEAAPLEPLPVLLREARRQAKAR